MMRPEDEAELYFKLGNYAECPKSGVIFRITTIRTDPDNYNWILGNKIGEKRYLFYREKWAKEIGRAITNPTPQTGGMLRRCGRVSMDSFRKRARY